MPTLRAELALPQKGASRRAFDAASGTFANASVVHDLARGRLLDRLELVRIDPALAVDLGSATGAGARELAQRFPSATVVAIDPSLPMLRALQHDAAACSRVVAVAGEAERMPFRSSSVGLVLANLVLPWSVPRDFFGETARVLEPGGLLLFATLGPDSLAEVRRAWAAADDRIHVHAFFDMHDLGDAAVSAGLAEPVVDVERIALTYTDIASFVRDLRACAATNTAAGRRQGLTGKERWRRFEAALLAQRSGSRFAITIELVFGQAWGRVGGAPSRSAPREASIPVERLRGSRKSVSRE